LSSDLGHQRKIEWAPSQDPGNSFACL
jgi:hypothetical protein